MRPLRLLVLALIALLAVGAAPGLAKKKPAKLVPVKGPLKAKVGIADQKSELFTDPLFQRLDLKYARRSVGWDAMDYDWQVADLDAWLGAARAAGVSPLITFARSRIASRRRLVPTAAQVRTGFLKFRQRYPWVTEFVASNESNHYGEPTGRRPKLAVQYYKALKAACPSCKIAAATLLDYPNLVTWTKQFLKYAKQQPRYWALHNYISANRFDASRTKQFLRATKGEVWITEVGGAVRRPRGQAKFAQGTRHAAKVTRYIFDRLVRVSNRITRVYLYHWNSDGPGSSWDSALVDQNGNPRPALTVVEKVLGKLPVVPGKANGNDKLPKAKPGIPTPVGPLPRPR